MFVETRRPVVGFDGYLVSDLGLVYSLWQREWSGGPGRGRLRGSRMVVDPSRPVVLQTFDRLSAKGKPTGYRSVCLVLDGVRKNRYVHDLVLSAFVGPRPTPDHEACHANRDRGDNRLSNLRWDTVKGNARDRILAGTQYSGEAWRLARGLLPRSLETSASYVGDVHEEAPHAFADLLEAAE